MKSKPGVVIHVDVGGQLTSRNTPSTLGFWMTGRVKRAVRIEAKTKEKYYRRYKGKIVRPVERLYCILLYYLIRNHLTNVSKIILCKDVNPQKIQDYLGILFKDQDEFNLIEIKFREKNSPKSKGHYPANKAYKKRTNADSIIPFLRVEAKLKEMLELK